MSNKPSKFVGSENRFDDVTLSHLVLKALASGDYNVQDDERLLNRLRHVDYGLSAQKECAAVLAWLGNCVLVHELEQEGYSSPGIGGVQIPDLLAVFSHGDTTLRTVVEVKSSDELHIPWTTEYQNKLAAYGRLVEMPVLLAWRPRKLGQWLLVDALSEELVTNGRIRLETAMIHNLMGVIAGDFHIDPEPSIGLNFRGQIIGEKKPNKYGFQATIKITEAFWGSRTGEKLTELNTSSVSLLMTTASEHYCEEKDGAMSWGYLTPGSPEGECCSISAQNLLRTLVGWAKKDDERIAWGHVLRDLEDVKSKKEMEHELEQNIGKTVRYIFYVLPKKVPSFVPNNWTKLLRKTEGST